MPIFFIPAIAVPVVTLIGVLAWHAHAKAKAAASPVAQAVTSAALPATSMSSAPATAANAALAALASLPAGSLHLQPLKMQPQIPAGVVHLIPLKMQPVANSTSDQIHSAASAVLASLPQTFSNDPLVLNRQIAVAALQYLIANPTPANLVQTIQTLAKNGSPEAQAAGVVLQQQPGMSQYMTQ